MAWQIWHGKRLYHDFYEFIPPGTAEFILLSWKIWGSASYAAAKLFFAVIWLFSFLGLFLTLREFQKATLKNILILFIFWLAVFYFYPLINHNSLSSLLAVWPLYFCLRFEKNGDNRWLLALGASVAFVCWILDTKGLALFVGFGVITCWTKNLKLKSVTSYLAGFIGMILALFWGYKPSTLYHFLFVYPREINYMGNTFFSYSSLIAALIIISVMFYTYIHQRNKWVFVLAILQLTLFLSILNNLTLGHLLINSFPFIIFVLMISLPTFLLQAQNTLIFLLIIFSLSCITDQLIMNTIGPNIFNLDFKNKSTLAIPGISTSDKIFAGPFLPGFWFELRKDNPYKYSMVHVCSKECEDQTLKTLKATSPDIIFLNYQMVKKYHYKKSAADLYIQNNYHKCKNYYSIEIYRKGECE